MGIIDGSVPTLNKQTSLEDQSFQTTQKNEKAEKQTLGEKSFRGISSINSPLKDTHTGKSLDTTFELGKEIGKVTGYKRKQGDSQTPVNAACKSPQRNINSARVNSRFFNA